MSTHTPFKIVSLCASGFAVLVSGCAYTGDIYPAGGDSFTVSATARGGFHSWSTVKGMALKEANEYCAKKGLQMVPVKEGTNGTRGWTPQEAELLFRCVKDAKDFDPAKAKGLVFDKGGKGKED